MERDPKGARWAGDLGASLTQFRQPVLEEIVLWLWHGGDAGRDLAFGAVKADVWL